MKFRSHYFIFVFIIISGLFACSSKRAASPTALTVQLKWVHQAQFAGFYVAADKGYYTQENINIKLSPIGILNQRPDANLIWVEDYGIHFYADTLFTTDQMIAENPDLVLRFLRATLKGEQFAIENPVSCPNQPAPCRRSDPGCSTPDDDCQPASYQHRRGSHRLDEAGNLGGHATNFE